MQLKYSQKQLTLQRNVFITKMLSSNKNSLHSPKYKQTHTFSIKSDLERFSRFINQNILFQGS